MLPERRICSELQPVYGTHSTLFPVPLRATPIPMSESTPRETIWEDLVKQHPEGPFPGRSWNRRDQPPSAVPEKDQNRMPWKEFVKKHPCPFPGRSWQRKGDLYWQKKGDLSEDLSEERRHLRAKERQRLEYRVPKESLGRCHQMKTRSRSPQ